MNSGRERKQEQLRFRLRYIRFETCSQARHFSICIQPPDYNYFRDRKYIYKFKAAPRQQDPVLKLIRQAIHKLNESSEHGLLMCNANIKAVPSTSAPPLWPLNGDPDTVKFYTFFQDEQEFPATVPISLIPKSGPLTADKLHVRRAGIWVPLSTWLVGLADPNLMRIRGIDSSNYFWRKRSKATFRLLDLPAEIRLMIFELAFGPSKSIYPLTRDCTSLSGQQTRYTLCQDFSSQPIMLGFGYKIGNRVRDPMLEALEGTIEGPGDRFKMPETYEAGKNVPEPPLALLCVSKQVNAEALQAAWEATSKCFLEYWIFIAVASSRVGVAIRYNVLGRIELGFTPKSWFNFLGVGIEPTMHTKPQESLVHHLAILPSRTDLCIRFRDPNDGWAADPWASSIELKTGRENQHTTCQTVLVDWILTFAFDHIKHMRVRIGGHARLPQRKSWENIFLAARTGRSHGHDNGAALDAIFALQSHELPPPCICPKSCFCEFRTRTHHCHIRFHRSSNFDFEDGSLPEDRLWTAEDVPWLDEGGLDHEGPSVEEGSWFNPGTPLSEEAAWPKSQTGQMSNTRHLGTGQVDVVQVRPGGKWNTSVN
ncbi:predicted protein [Plenodomus lingam JN3]|uniref:Predicted protein n=1 Tax=Leptosphaeria maculans (strain JN3 / isolate v23.1.3 / race Av1-4-5-6-7-8) TaxID=985895 RepID=E4ZY20_LEPMJ|nr:predicted protein [Plenodomus lingam JN3]CBX96265.1 predicted protein [Plenodomus lingam JN3]